jgi:hypothetical protein
VKYVIGLLAFVVGLNWLFQVEPGIAGAVLLIAAIYAINDTYG